MSSEVAAAYAFQVQERVVAAKTTIYEAWVDMAAGLYEFSSEQLWKTLGHDSFEAWLADPVIDLSRSWVFTLVSVYRELVVLQNVPEESLRGLNPSKLQDVLPVVRKRALPVGNVLADVESLSRGDLRERYRSGGTGTTQSANGSVPDDSTHYDAEREPQFVRCPVCQSRVREDQIRGRDAS
jgi:hypothetical protein